MNDVTEALSKYIEGMNHINYLGDSSGLDFIQSLLLNGQQVDYETPDMIVTSEYGNLIIEHFEFDCYESNRKGSKNRQELARVERMVDSISNGEGAVVFDEIKGKSSFDYYVSNLLAVFNNHYIKNKPIQSTCN